MSLERVKKYHKGINRAAQWAGAVVLGLAAGCATPPPVKTPELIFYPPSPAIPRLQYLTSFSEEQDLGRRHNRLFTFLVGALPPAIPLVKPYGVILRHNKLYACDTVTRSITIFDLDRKRLSHWTPRGEGRLQTPINLTFDEAGAMYVADAQRGQVLKFDPNGTYRGAVGGVADMKPTDVAVTAGRLYITDLLHHNVAVYDRSDLARLFTIPRDTADPAAQLFSPTNIALDPEGRVYVTDSGAFRVQLYDADGAYRRAIGQHGDGPGEFARPKGLAVDRQGLVYVVDAAMQVVQLFDAQGRMMLYFGEPEAGPAALNLPADVWIDYDHVDRFRAYAAPGFGLEYLVLVSNQYGDRKINVYGFGHSL